MSTNTQAAHWIYTTEEWNSYKYQKYLDIIFKENDIKVIYDIGANIGGTAKIFLDYAKKNNKIIEKIYCFEPDTENMSFLKDKLNSSRLSFGSDERLFEFLGVYTGAVSPFCMINGKKYVQLFFEIELQNFDNLILHPFVCDRSIKISLNDIKKFLDFYGVKINWISI